jgi:hypothetical protein
MSSLWRRFQSKGGDDADRSMVDRMESVAGR